MKWQRQLDVQISDWERARRAALAEGAPDHVADVIADHEAGVFGLYTGAQWNDYIAFLRRQEEPEAS